MKTYKLGVLENVINDKICFGLYSIYYKIKQSLIIKNDVAYFNLSILISKLLFCDIIIIYINNSTVSCFYLHFNFINFYI